MRHILALQDQQDDIPEDRGADQQDEVFHDPINEATPNSDPLNVSESTPPTFDPGGVYQDNNFNLRDTETNQSFMDPESFDYVTLTMDFDYLSQPEETIKINHYQFDKESA